MDATSTAGGAERSGVHRVAAVGNAVFAAFLAILLSHDRLFVAAPAPPLPPGAGGAEVRANRALLVIVDGLRADTAADAALMPALARLRQSGHSATVTLDSLIPSTIAGITALATGTTSPPTAVLQDLRALPADDGGVLAAVKAAGGRCFVAGPPVWGDRFGRWIDDFRPLEHLVGSDDRPVVDAGAAALASGDFRLVVVHLGGPDDAAHAFGTRSPQYASAAAAADAAIGRLLARTAAGDLVLVTADHGNTTAGGHAGPEDDVIRVPLVVAGGPGITGWPAGVRRQAEIAPFVARALGTSLRSEGVRAEGAARPAVPLLVTVVACGAALWVCAGAARGSGSRLPPTLLNAAVWLALVAAVVGWRWAAVGGLAAALVGAAIATGSGRGALSTLLAAAAATAAGTGLGVLRLLDGAGPTWASASWRDAALAASTLAAFLGGRALHARLRRPGGHHPVVAALAGAALVFLVVTCGRLAGQTLSLSTLDVRAAYNWAARPVTAPLAALVVVLVHAAPALAASAGVWPAVRRMPAATAGALAAGTGAVLVGQLLACAAVLWAADGVRPSALALGGLLRASAEGVYLFVALAGVLVLPRHFVSR